MLVPPETLASLSVFSSVLHPSTVLTGQGVRDGLSLYLLLNHCHTQLGRSALKTLLRNPPDKAGSQSNLSTTKAFFMSQNLLAMQTLLRRVSPLNMEASADSQARLFLTRLYLTLAASGYLIQIMPDCEPKLALAAAFSKDITTLYQLLSATLDFPQLPPEIDQQTISKVLPLSFRSKHGSLSVSIRPGARSSLDSCKMQLRHLSARLTLAASNELRALPESSGISQCRVLFVPQLGYVLQFSGDDASIIRGGLGQTTEEQSFSLADVTVVAEASSVPPQVPVKHSVDTRVLAQLGYSLICDWRGDDGGSVQIKTNGMRALDSELGDVQAELVRQESQAFASLLSCARLVASQLTLLGGILAQIDVCCSLADCAKLYGWSEPVFTPDKVLSLRGVWHPLAAAQLTPHPIDIILPDSGVMVIGGFPGTGKSFCLEAAALAVYLAAIGSFVPASQAVIGDFSGLVLLNASIPGAVSGKMSSFTRDMLSFKEALQQKSPGSLILLDDPTIGTHPRDSSALLVASIFYCAEDCCVIAATRDPSVPRLLSQRGLKYLSTYSMGVLVTDGLLIPQHVLKKCNDMLLAGTKEWPIDGSTCSQDVLYGRCEAAGFPQNSLQFLRQISYLLRGDQDEELSLYTDIRNWDGGDESAMSIRKRLISLYARH